MFHEKKFMSPSPEKLKKKKKKSAGTVCKKNESREFNHKKHINIFFLDINY